MSKPKHNISAISKMHYAKLVGRSALFLMALYYYITAWRFTPGAPFDGTEFSSLYLVFIFVLFMGEMLLRYFPSRLESPGCQKQFAKNYIPKLEDTTGFKLDTAKSTAAVAAAWVALNGAIGVLYFMGIIDAGLLLLIALAYSICDMICILFFCPFQSWFMKNRCCTTCRIYNWDFAMMFTPFLFIPGVYTWSLLGMSLGLFLVWETLVHTHPERFSTKTNACMDCKHCDEKLCKHKKQLKSLWKKIKPTF